MIADGTCNRNSGAAQRVVRNGALNLLGQGLYAATYLVVVAVLARGLGKEGFGEYFLVFALIVALQTLLEMSVSTVLTRRIAQSPDHWKARVAEAGGIFALISLGSLVVFVALGLGWAWIRGEAGMIATFTAAGLACAAIQIERFCGGILHAFEQFHDENLAKIVQVVFFTAAVAGVVALGWATPALALALLAASHLLAAGYLLAVVQRRWHCLAWRWHAPTVRDWLGESVPLGLGDVVRSLTWQLDTLLLGVMQPAAVVGIYSMAYRPLGPVNWLPRCILQAAFPSFARLAGQDRAALDRAFAASIRLLWVVSLPIAIGICVCAEPVIVLMAGAEYLEAVLPMRLLIWITCLSFLSFQFRYLFTALGQARLYIRLVVPVLLLEAAIEAVLIPWYGQYGACAGSLLGEFVFTAAGLFFCYRLGVRRIDGTAMARALLAGAVMALCLWLARGASLPLLAVVALLATGLYFVLCIVFGALRRDEVQCLYQAGRGLVRVGRSSIYRTRRKPAKACL
jgi:O-antigen/teichoic acid export membrane protein